MKFIAHSIFYAIILAFIHSTGVRADCVPATPLPFSDLCNSQLDLLSLKDLSLYQAIDAWGKPSGMLRGTFTSLGNLFECLDIDGPNGLRFNYVMVQGSIAITFPQPSATNSSSSDDEIAIDAKAHSVNSSLSIADFTLASQLGICVPAGCANSADVSVLLGVKNLMEIMRDRALCPGEVPPKPFVTSALKSIANSIAANSSALVRFNIAEVGPYEETNYDRSFVIMSLVMVGLASITFLATFIDYLYRYRMRSYERQVELIMMDNQDKVDADSLYPDLGESSCDSPLMLRGSGIELPPRPHCSRLEGSKCLRTFMTCFSLYTTIPALFSTEIKRFKELKCLNAIRVLSIWWVAFGHTFGEILRFVPLDVLRSSELLGHSAMMMVMNAFFSVDTFFFLSAFLVAYMMYSNPDNLRKFRYIRFALFRILRLTPSYAFAIFTWWFIFPKIGNGPMWYGVKKQIEVSCSKYWWTNLLYISNFYPERLSDECMPWGWYLAADYHLYLIAPVFIFALTWRRKWLGYGFILFGFVAQGLITIIPAYMNDVPALPSLVKGRPVSEGGLIADLQIWQLVYYQKSYNHLSIMLGGIVTAYIVANARKNRRRASFMGFWNQIWVLLSISIGIAILFADIYLPFDYIGKYSSWPTYKNVLYLYFSRIAWSIGLGLIIIPIMIEPRQTQLLSRIFEWEGWIVMGRLNFSVYLVHCFILNFYWGSTLEAVPFSNVNVFHMYGGILWWSYVIGAVVFVFIEHPISQLVRLIKL